jgi:hypothetical protein
MHAWLLLPPVHLHAVCRDLVVLEEIAVPAPARARTTPRAEAHRY